MKYSITTLPIIPVIITIPLIYQLNIISLLIAGGVSIYWILHHFIFIQKEKNLLREGIQYFMDSFGNIRTPIALIHSPLKTAYNDNCPENTKRELLLAIRSIDCLNEHLAKLMNLKELFTHSGRMDIAEYELGKFIRNKADFLRDHATNNQIKLEVKTEFKYASAWFDPGKISPIIDKFIRNAIDHAEQKQTIILVISTNPQNWQIKITDFESRRLTQCYKCKKRQLLKRKEELEYNFAKSVFCKKLIRLCNGKILINHSQHSILLRFPLKYTHKSMSEYTPIQFTTNQEEKKIDSIFCKETHKRKSVKPTVLLADSNADFRAYLETRLSENFIVKSFSNGSEALTYIREEYPDIVICDMMLHGMYGNELSSRLKTSGETSIIPIILYGSYPDSRLHNTRENSLADVFLHTPFHIEDLKIEMNVLIKNSRFLRKSFLQKIFGEQFLKVKENEVLNENNYAFINRVKDYILKNIDQENLTIDEVASELYMSRTTFFNKWKSLTGEAPKYFIYRIRMEKARELLESGKYSVNVIPEMIGLKNLKNFRQKYKEYFGITPSESITKKQ